MKTVFCTGLFPDRQVHLLSALVQNFDCILFKNVGFAPAPGYQFRYVEDLVETGPSGLEEYLWQLHRGAREMENTLRMVLDDPEAELTKNEMLRFHQVGQGVWRDTVLFDRLCEKVRIDGVVVCADYDFIKRRNIIIKAKERGIPTVNIDHGSHFAYVHENEYKENRDRKLENLCDYVNVDNELEKIALQGYYDSETPGPTSTFVVHGTPMDSGYESSLSRDEAHARLGLDPSKVTLCLMSTWDGGQPVGDLVKPHVATVEALGAFLDRYRDFPHRDDLQVIYKLHPTFVAKDLFAAVKGAWDRACTERGLDPIMIETQKLTEIFSAADMVVTPSTSSVIWDSFLKGIPAIIEFPPWFQDRFAAPERVPSTNLIFERQAVQASFSPDQTWELVARYMDPGERESHAAGMAKLREEYDIRAVPLPDAIARLVGGIKAIFEQK